MKQVISKSAKKKMCSQVQWPFVGADGKEHIHTEYRQKANDYTQMVVYKTKVGSKLQSVTKHERREN